MDIYEVYDRERQNIINKAVEIYKKECDDGAADFTIYDALYQAEIDLGIMDEDPADADYYDAMVEDAKHILGME